MPSHHPEHLRPCCHTYVCVSRQEDGTDELRQGLFSIPAQIMSIRRGSRQAAETLSGLI